jgi:hypothetical protein
MSVGTLWGTSYTALLTIPWLLLKAYDRSAASLLFSRHFVVSFVHHGHTSFLEGSWLVRLCYGAAVDLKLSMTTESF